METTEEKRKDDRMQCSNCDSSEARCWCVDCNEALCDECVLAHRRVTLTRSHKILNQPPTMGNVSTLPTKFCRVHPSEPLKLYCVTCRTLTCRDCQLMAHLNHRYYFTDELIVIVKKEMEGLRAALAAQRDRVKKSLQDMETRLQDIEESKTEVMSQLQHSYNVISQAISKRVQELSKATKSLSELETNTIRERMEKLKQAQIEQQSLFEAAEKAQRNNDTLALVHCSSQIRSQLKSLSDKDTSPPAEMTKIQIVTSRQMLDILLKFGDLDARKVPFSVTQTPNQSADPPPYPNPLSVHLSTYMDSQPAPPVSGRLDQSSSSSAQPCVPPPSGLLVSQPGALPTKTQVVQQNQLLTAPQVSLMLLSNPVANVVTHPWAALPQRQPPAIMLQNNQALFKVTPVAPQSCTIMEKPRPQTTTCDITRPPAVTTASQQLPVCDTNADPAALKQDSLVVRAVADSACDLGVQQVTAKQQEPAENEPSSTVSEEKRPPAVPELSALSGHTDAKPQRPVVSPESCPVPGFRVVIGNEGEEIYMEERDEDAQTPLDDVTVAITDDATGSIMDDVTYDDDVMVPSPSPDSPVTLQIVTCCVCGAAYGSIVCSSCGLGFHRDCHLPPIGPELWTEWNCSLCQNLFDESDPFSADRAERPESLSLKEQRACETLLLRLKIEGSTRLSQSASVWSHVESISQRLTQRRTPHYKTTTEFVRDVMGPLKNMKDDKFSQKLRKSFQRWVKDTLMVARPASDRATRGRAAELKVKAMGTDMSKEWPLKRLQVILQQCPPKKTKTEQGPPQA